ncbi:CDP-alcohol phosphatidyltransferase family protein [Candidatus Uhrbacteria bacterium]|nr:CDP-alcohol phosphatidyltransferase family protein [Candidatus Uhrbacteria bacterium]
MPSSETSTEALNSNIKLTFYDKLFALTILRIIPYSVKPNHVTMVRFVTAPLVFWLLLKEYYAAGLAAFLLVALTDAIDGAMARTRRQITLWGIIYDGVADKFLIGGAVLMLVFQEFGMVLAGFVLGLEFFGILAGLYFKNKGIVRAANLWGKIKMNLQVIGVALLLIHIIDGARIFRDASFWIFISAIGVGVISLIVHARTLEHS